MRGYAIKGVGFIHVKVHAMSQDIVIIESIVVNEEYQGLGVGQLLMRLVRNDADNEQAQLWLTTVHPEGHWVNKWYERIGFVRNEISGYYIRKPQKVMARGGYVESVISPNVAILSEGYMDPHLEKVLRDVGMDPEVVKRNAIPHYTRTEPIFSTLRVYCTECGFDQVIPVQLTTTNDRKYFVGHMECGGCGKHHYVEVPTTLPGPNHEAGGVAE